MTTSPFVAYNGSDPAYLLNSLLASNSGIQIVAGSVVLSASAPDAVSVYDGSLAASLGIGAGLLLTSGTMPGTSNTVGWFGQDNTHYAADGTPINFNNGAAAIDAVVNAVFQTQSYDATLLSFDFLVTDPNATSVSFEIVFGSDEYPEWVDQFVDCAVIIVNGVNYAYFNHDPNAPLSVIGPNLAAGYFQDNAGNILTIEYDGVSHVLKIVAPIIPGAVNSITIGVADTGDHIYDSGIFIANMAAGTTPGSGVVLTPSVPCTDGNDTVSGTVADELITLLGGDDTAYAGGGDDIVVAGAGNDKVYGGSGNDVLEGDGGDDYLDGGEGVANEAVYAGQSADYSVSYNSAAGTYTVTGAEGTDTLTNIQLIKFADGLFDLTPNGITAHATGSGGAVNALGSVVISGGAIVGQALTAIVIDSNGVPIASGAISYQWLTSADNGATWVDTGVTSKTFLVGQANAGLQVMALASYTDNAGYAESPGSAAVTVATTQGLTLSLIHLSAPEGAGVMNPLTTLLSNAIALGFSANEAQLAIKTVFNLPAIDLKTYDPVAILNANPTDAQALTVLKICGELAMSASASDATAFNLTVAVMEAFAQQQTINLADPNILASLLGGISPQALQIVQTTNKDMADAKSLSVVLAAWDDFCGNTDYMETYKGSFGSFNVDINQAPVGFSTATLQFGTVNTDYTITQADLLAGFTDPDGDPLTISDLTADTGGQLFKTPGGDWMFVPNPGFVGPVELTFLVKDPSGAAAAGSAMFVIAAPSLDTVAPTVTAMDFAANDGTLKAGETITLTVTLSEAVSVTGTPKLALANGGTASYTGGSGTNTLTFSYTAAAGQDTTDLTTAISAALTGSITDLAGNAVVVSGFNGVNPAGSLAVDTVAPTVSISDNVAGTATGAVTYTLTFAEPVFGLASSDFTVTNGTVTSVTGSGSSYTVTVTPTAGFEGNLDLSLNASAVSDAAGNANAVAMAATQVVDTRAPTVTAFSPASGATSVAVGSNIVLTFSEGIARGAGTIEIRQGSATGALIESFNVATSTRLSLSGSTLTIDPTSNLANATNYVIVVNPGAVIDVAGNAYSGTSLYGFTTIVAGNVINGTANADTLTGTTGVDIINGLAGNDVITGGAGVDVMDGGDGSDIYIVAVPADHSAAEFKDTGASGTDEVRFASATANSTLTLYAGDVGLERAVIGTGTAASAVTTGTTALNINAAALTYGLALVGNAGANILTSGAGNDTLTGNGGIDTFVVTAGTDTITDLGTGGADILNVAAGATVNATVTAAWTASAATVNKGTANITTNGLAVNLAAVTATTAGNLGYNVTNTGAATTLTGSALADRLTGGTGNDVLVGGAGVDVLNGASGSDIYIVAATADHSAAEFADTGTSGIDEVRFTSTTAGSTLTLYAGDTGLERAVIGTGTGSSAVVTGTTALNINAAALTYGITLVGNAGANTLTGGSGDDLLQGGAGNDTLIGGAGFDYADYSTATTAITVNLALTTAQATGGAGTDTLSGIEGIIGGSGADTLTGDANANIFYGKLGNDVLTGGGGADQFRFDTTPNTTSNKDTITDFVSGTDKLCFSKAIFTGLSSATVGALSADAFWSGAGVTAAHDATDRFIYNTTTGVLYYDPDGTGSAAAVQVALLGATTHPTLAYTDIMVFA